MRRPDDGERQQPQTDRHGIGRNRGDDWIDAADRGYRQAVDIKVKFGLALLVIGGIYYGLKALF